MNSGASIIYQKGKSLKNNSKNKVLTNERKYIIKLPIINNTIDYKYGISYNEFKNLYKDETFYPATFLIITGDKEDDINLVEYKKNIIDNIFNKIENIDGKFIKLILGSRVMNEGTTLENVGEVHILDAYYNLGKIY
jgi:hypothetical protein